MICSMQLLSDEFIQDNVVSKAKLYDFLPIAYNSDLILNKIRSEFTESKLNAQIEIAQKFNKIQTSIESFCTGWQDGFYPEYKAVKDKSHKLQTTLKDMKLKHTTYIA